MKVVLEKNKYKCSKKWTNIEMADMVEYRNNNKLIKIRYAFII